MPTEDSKRYLELKGRLDNLSIGIKKHSTDPKFPSNITSDEVDSQSAQLTLKRKSFEEAANIAHQKSEEYSIEYENCDEYFSKLASQIYGFYGKQNLIVEDFGLKPYQKPTGRKAKNSEPTIK